MRRAAIANLLRALALALLAAAAAAIACAPAPRLHASRGDWDERWPQLARRGARWPVGTTWVLATFSGERGAVVERVERWQLLRSDSTDGEFEYRGEAAAPRLVRMRLHPGVPRIADPAGGAGVYPVIGGFVPVRLPGGRFDCGRTWRDRTEHDGRVVRIEEWWAPNIPVPVQRWERRAADADLFAPPPRDRQDVASGVTWSVLLAIRQP